MSRELTPITVAGGEMAVDISPQQIEERMVRLNENRKAFLKFVRKHMKKDIHYMEVPGRIPYLKQEGAMDVKDFYRCTVGRYEVLSEQLDFDTEIYAVCIQALLVLPSGMEYRGLGWANSRENNFQARIKKEGFGTMLETVGQMARKRALVNAVRHLPFVAELFTEEYTPESSSSGSDSDSDSPKGKEKEKEKGEELPKDKNGDPASEKQVNYLKSIYKKHELYEALKDVVDLQKVTKEQASWLIENGNKGKKAAEQAIETVAKKIIEKEGTVDDG